MGQHSLEYCSRESFVLVIVLVYFLNHLNRAIASRILVFQFLHETLLVFFKFLHVQFLLELINVNLWRLVLKWREHTRRIYVLKE